MGVTGLWQLISSTGKPVPLESLEGKVLAVDVSVWLHQLSKGMRDGSGNPVPNAHLHGLFTRICKLLHCRIKPVFVFDGGVPALKKQTLANRKSRREDAEKSSELMQQKILTNLIRSQVLQTAAGDGLGPIGPYYTKPKARGDKDAMFELPPIPESSKGYLNENLHQEDAFVERRELQALIEEEYEDVNQINVESEDFKSLPAEIQHEIIYDIQQNRKNYNMSKIAELPSDSNDFSSYQMSKLLKHSKLHSRLEEVRKEINNRQTQDLSKYYTKDLYGADVQSHRLVSDETSHVLLIKGLKNKHKNLEEEERKKQQEKEKRRKNMKLLEKVFPGMSEESSYTDELLHDSDYEDIKHLDFLNVNQPQLSEKIIPQDTKPEQVRLDNKPRFKAKIEIETDTSDEEESLVQKVTKCRTSVTNDFGNSIRNKKDVRRPSADSEAIMINDDMDSEDEDLQRAIALSLQQNSENKPLLEDSSVKNDRNPKETDSEHDYVVSVSEEQTMDKNASAKKHTKYMVSNEVIVKSDAEYINKRTAKKKASLRSNIGGKRGQFKAKQHSHLPKRRRLKASKHTQQIQKMRSKSKALIFKRQLSNLSNEDLDNLIPSKVMVTDQSWDRNHDGTVDNTNPSTAMVTNQSDTSEDSIPSKDMVVDSEHVTVDIQSEGSADSSEDEFIEVKIDPSNIKEDSLFHSDEFIEVKIDPSNIKEDSLFPSSMFDNSGGKGQIKSLVQVDSSYDESESDSRSALDDTITDERQGGLKYSLTDNKTNSETKSVTIEDDIGNNNKRLPATDDEKSVDLPDQFGDIFNSSGDDSQHENEKKNIDEELTEDRSRGKASSNNVDMSDEQEESSVNKGILLNENDQENLTILSQESKRSSVDLTDEREGSVQSQGSVVISEENLDNMGSPRPSGKDLVKEFKAMDEILSADSSWRLTLKNLGNTNPEWNIRGMREKLAGEEKKLLQERGKQERLAMSITDQMHTEAQELLQLFGIPFIVSPTEAEAQCAQLDYSKQTQGTITDDSDIWLFGGTCVYKNFFNQQKYVECFKMDSIQSKLGLTRQSLINIALLCGSDYTDGIQGVGPVTAMEILAEFPGDGLDGLTNFRTWWEKAQTEIKVKNEKKFRLKLRDLEIKEGFPHPNVVEAYLNPTVDDSSERFTWGTPDLDQLRQFALDKLGWTKVKVDETLQPVLKRMNDRQNQMRISAYFQPEIYMQPAKVKSKRLQNVVDKFLGVETGETDKPPDKPGRGKKTKGKHAQKADKGVEDQGNEIEEKADKIEPTNEIKSQTTSDTVNENQGKDTKDGKKGKASANKGKATKGLPIKSSKIATVEPQRASTSGYNTRKTKRKQEAESIIESSDYSSDSESDSSSGSADSDSDVVEKGLQVSEILGLQIGPGLSLTDTPAGVSEPSKVSQKVFVSGLNVEEILNLDSGDPGVKGCEMDDNMLEQWDPQLKTSLADIPSGTNTDRVESNEVSNDIDFTNEGGFLGEDSNDSSTKDTVKEEKDSPSCVEVVQDGKNLSWKRESGDLDEVPTVEKKGTRRQTRTRNTNKTQDTEVKTVKGSSNTSASANNESVINTQTENKRQTRALKQKCSDDRTKQGKSEVKKTAKSESLEPIESKPNIENIKVEAEEFNVESNKESDQLTYTNNPIKKLLTGVPWENRGTKRGRITKGQGKVKAIKVEPTENVQKKKRNVKVNRKPIGVVNLSESSSDSN